MLGLKLVSKIREGRYKTDKPFEKNSKILCKWKPYHFLSKYYLYRKKSLKTHKVKKEYNFNLIFILGKIVSCAKNWKNNMSALYAKQKINFMCPKYHESKFSLFQQKELFYKLDFHDGFLYLIFIQMKLKRVYTTL